MAFDVRFWHISDMARCVTCVRFRGKSGSPIQEPSGPFVTRSGHLALALKQTLML
jgi:hypothetical protein